MGIQFIAKSNLSIPNRETIDLCNFLKNNKHYIGITLKVISQVKTPIPKAETMSTLINNKIIKEDFIRDKEEIEGEYITKMLVVYQHEKNELSKIRGDILEIISKEMVLCKRCKEESNWNVITEALVVDKGIPIQQKDIDVVFDHCKVELLECKCSLHNYVKEPVDQKTKEKLSFMEQARKLSSTAKETIVYFVTAKSTDDQARETLNNLGYTHFAILKAQDIIQYI